MKQGLQSGGLKNRVGTSKWVLASLLPALCISLPVTPVHAQGEARSGEEVVKQVCATCHAGGENGAPMIGDTDAWSKRSAQGLSSLTSHALDGIRNMPAHGGDAQLGDLEIARAVTYMVNQSGGNWVEPESAADLAKQLSGEQVVEARCASCHAEGVDGAPRVGDLQAWVKRMQQGLPYLVNSAIHGHGGMPPRGGQANLTDAEIRSAILYMYNPAGIPKAASSGSTKQKAATDPNHKFVDGIEIFLGLMPAENLRILPKDSPERKMHGGIPKGSGYYHVNVSLHDEKSHAPINDARVRMQFDWPGLESPPVKLEPMALAGSYGNYVKPQPGTSYKITLHIKRPGTDKTVEATFEHKF